MRRSGDRRRRQRALRAARPSAGRCATTPRYSASAPIRQIDFIHELRGRRARLSDRSGSDAQAAARLGRGAGSLRELDRPTGGRPKRRSSSARQRRRRAEPRARRTPLTPLPGFFGRRERSRTAATPCPAMRRPRRGIGRRIRSPATRRPTYRCQLRARAPGSSPASMRTPTSF